MSTQVERVKNIANRGQKVVKRNEVNRTQMYLNEKETVINTDFLKDAIVVKLDSNGNIDIGKIYHFNIGGKNFDPNNPKPSDKNRGQFLIGVNKLLPSGGWSSDRSNWWFSGNETKDRYLMKADPEVIQAFDDADFTRKDDEWLATCLADEKIFKGGNN